jgi:hypothetical protein
MLTKSHFKNIIRSNLEAGKTVREIRALSIFTTLLDSDFDILCKEAQEEIRAANPAPIITDAAIEQDTWKPPKRHIIRKKEKLSAIFFSCDEQTMKKLNAIVGSRYVHGAISRSRFIREVLQEYFQKHEEEIKESLQQLQEQRK